MPESLQWIFWKSEISDFFKKPPKPRNFVDICLHYFCTILYMLQVLLPSLGGLRTVYYFLNNEFANVTITCNLVPMNWTKEHLEQCRPHTLFWMNNSRTLKDTFSIFQGLHAARTSAALQCSHYVCCTMAVRWTRNIYSIHYMYIPWYDHVYLRQLHLHLNLYASKTHNLILLHYELLFFKCELFAHFYSSILLKIVLSSYLLVCLVFECSTL